MKFGRNLPRNVVPEWSSSYINYKALKKLIKSASNAQEAKDDVDLVGFFYSLDRNLEDVDHFYNKKLADFTRRLKILEDRFGNSLAAGQALDADNIGDLVTALLELRGQLRKLQWYGEVNRRGFIKITKKLDKKIPGAQAQKRYLAAKVDPAPFASNAQLTQATTKINEWLSILGDRKVSDDTDSVKSLTLSKVPSRPTLNLPPTLLSAVDAALRKDDTSALSEQLESLKAFANEQGELVYPMFQKNLLQRAIACRARSSIDLLLGDIDSLEEEDDINKRNCIHRLVISIGRAQSTSDIDPSGTVSLDYPEESTYITPAAAPSLQPPRNVVKEAHQKQLLTRDDEAVSLLQYLLDHLRPHQQRGLLARDLSGRTPLHYGAQYGFRVVCEIIIEHLKQWNMFDVSEGIDGPNWQDSEGWAPLHLSVVGGHPLTTKALLQAEEESKGASQEGKRNAIRKHISKSSAVLAMAVKANFVDIVQLLVEAGVDINYQDEQGETALHVAARFNHSQCAKLLLDGTADQKANTELAETTYSWTPLFVACVDGALAVTELLIKAGADLERPDSSGWTAKEHAALRGHLEIAKRLAEVTKPPSLEETDGSITVPAPTSSPPLGSLADRRSNINTTSSPNYSSRSVEPLKTFGHRYLTDESMILVSLGTMDMRKTSPPVSLDRIPITSAHTTQLDTALSVVVSASGAHGEPEIIDLPVQDSIVTEPITFYSKDFTSVRLLFDLVPTYAGSTNRIVGRGVALLSSIRPSVGSNRISLQGDITVPIIAANTLEVIGTLTFNFLVVTPFSHPKMSLNHDQTYWKTVTAPMVIGHRGLGKNFASRRSLQLGENTVQSFIAAANLGASYVEFDVQLTKDHVPVIYHDFLVSETGIDAPVHTLTLDQFLHLNDAQSPRMEAVGADASQRPRAMSVGEALIDPAALSEKMKHTRDFKAKGFKGNTRGNHIQAPFATLEELFRKLPKSVGFNIEMKYPSLYESEAEEMDTYAVEANSFVDTVLEKVYELGEGRNMIFSSFNPDICLLLSFKQPSIPVLFLTDAGSSEVGDIRASSLQEAIRFASRWNLLGIVSTAEPFVLCPRLVRVVKESGLVCVSYGTENNDPENAKLQVTNGIDAVIVDSVLAIRKGLTTAPPSSSASPLSFAQASSTQTLQPPADISTLDKPSHIDL
ncbi:glycerophosphocholine phosphodiesterase Gde1, putative [Talaromyces marneffei ATCC 18224]|uniref:Glycerophosphocholine phosphodiesterase Gde1, putative n=1 Tax=Talaromyces marneffei (strain ATCC 18224 / CBS 334.59 / QM 7333) TaxID=441960 RepID=B6Q4F9_TALMQ|nr:glycerophosphocholine phosphodiesterase Gde1, putative [Talaromyces marneffei ATCC 18224]